MYNDDNCRGNNIDIHCVCACVCVFGEIKKDVLFKERNSFPSHHHQLNKNIPDTICERKLLAREKLFSFRIECNSLIMCMWVDGFVFSLFTLGLSFFHSFKLFLLNQKLWQTKMNPGKRNRAKLNRKK